MKVELMSPGKVANQVSEETGVTIKVLLAVTTLLVTVIISVSGVGVAGIVKVNSMGSDITALGVQLENVTNAMEASNEAKFSVIMDDLSRRNLERWTRSNMSAYSYKCEQVLRAAGVNVTLPEIAP